MWIVCVLCNSTCYSVCMCYKGTKYVTVWQYIRVCVLCHAVCYSVWCYNVCHTVCVVLQSLKVELCYGGHIILKCVVLDHML